MEIQSLAMLANMLAHQFNIEVSAVGDEAYCTFEKGKTSITVPAFIADTDADRTYARGYIDHEIGHARFTDRNATDGMITGSALHRITNILEDVFVERMMGRCYPGCAINLAKMQKQLFVIDKAFDKVVPPSPMDGDAVILYRFFKYLLYRARGIDELIPEAEASLDEVLPGMAGKLDALLKERLPKCNSTADNIQLAKDIRAMFCNEAKEQSKQDYQEAANEAGATAKFKEKANSSEAKRQASNCMQDSKQCSEGAMEMIHVRLEAAEKAMQHMLDSSNSKVRANNPSFRSGGRDLTQSQRAVSAVTTHIKNMAMGCAVALSAQLQSLMQAKVLRKRRVGMQGKLDTNRLHRITMNNPNVFLRNNETKQVNTQVVLLGDTSGSMCHIKDLASASMYAVMSALRNIHGVSSAAFGFGNSDIATMCDFNTPLYMSSMYIQNPNGGTPGGSALMRILQKFDMTKPETRKILFFITDGEFPDSEVTTFVAAYKAAKEAGIDVIGIGIETDAVEHLWKDGDFFVINDIKELAPKLFYILKKRMV